MINKYIISIIFYYLFFYPFIFILGEYDRYIEILVTFFELVGKIFDCFEKYETFNCILGIIATIFVLILLTVFQIVIPFFLHFIIKDLYYFQFLPKIRDQYNNKLITLSIILGEEIFSLVFLFPLMTLHYIHIILFFSILGLVKLFK